MWNGPPFVPSSARSIISNRSPAVNGFFQVNDSSALPIARRREAPGRSAAISRTTARCPRWNGWNRPTRRPRIPGPSLGRQVLDVLEELIDMGASRGQVMPAVTAVLVVVGPRQPRVELEAGTVDEPFLVQLLLLREGDRTRRSGRMDRDAERSSHEPAGRPLETVGVAEAGGVSSPDRFVASTIAARRSSNESFLEPFPASAYLSTSLRVRTGMTSIAPR